MKTYYCDGGRLLRALGSIRRLQVGCGLGYGEDLPPFGLSTSQPCKMISPRFLKLWIHTIVTVVGPSGDPPSGFVGALVGCESGAGIVTCSKSVNSTAH